ncbi:MAG: hypothetical protein J1F66_03935 [Clostridiales bacterium]|nr:hypothetical protein [Clostridiales bacterium]
MIEEVVNSILEAEDEAKRRVENAEREAGEIVSNAELEADKRRKTAAAENKKYLSDKLAAADSIAAKRAQEVLADAKQNTDAEIRELEKRVDATAKIILELL